MSQRQVETSRSFIAYQPPGWGQAVRPGNARGAYAAVRRFLSSCTDWRGSGAPSRLSIHEPGQHSPPDYDPEPLLLRAAAAFGPGERKPGIRPFPETGEVQYKHEWKLSSSELDTAIEFVTPLPRWPAKYLAPVLLSTSLHFLLCEPRTGGVLPGQTREGGVGYWPVSSSLILHLGGSPTATFDLRFPFEKPERAFLEYLKAVLPFLPIRLGWNRFRLMVPTGGGTDYLGHKLDAALFGALKQQPGA